jgi:hypothetical protein
MKTPQKVGVFLDEKVYDRVKRLALDEKISMTKWISRLVDEAVKSKRKAA